MIGNTKYVRSVRKVVGAVTQQWEAREDNAAFNKWWEIHYEAAQEIAAMAWKASADPSEVPALVRRYYFRLASDVRGDMANGTVDCATARKSVATRVRRRTMDTKDVVKVVACHAAASLLEAAGDAWVTAPSATLSAAYIGGERLWTYVLAKAQTAANAASANRAQPCEIWKLFGGFFTHFMAIVATRRKVERLSWGAAKKRVSEIMIRGYIPKDPVRAAAFITAALTLEAIPSGDTPESRTSSPAYPEPRRALAPAAAAATAAAELAPGKGTNAPSAHASANVPAATESSSSAKAGVGVNVLSTPKSVTPSTATPILGTRDTVASMTKGCGPNLLKGATSPDHAPTSSPPPGGRNSNNNNNNNNNNNTATGCTVKMPPPTGNNRTRWAKQRYSRSGSVNDPTRTESASAVSVGERANRLPATASPVTPTLGQPVDATVGAGVKPQPTPSSGFSPSMDTVGAGSSSSGPYDVSEGASIAPEAPPAMAMQAVGAASGATASPPPFSADQCAGAVGPSTSGQRTSKDLPETDADDDINWYGLMNTLVPTAPEASTGENVDVDTTMYTPSVDALGPANSESLRMAPNVPVASELAAVAVTPSPVIAGAGVGGAAAATTVAPPGTALGSSVLVAAEEEAAARVMAPTAAGAASSPVAEGSNTGRGKKRKPTDGGGGGENPACDGGATKKARSE